MMMLTMMMILETWAEEDVDIDCVGEVGGEEEEEANCHHFRCLTWRREPSAMFILNHQKLGLNFFSFLFRWPCINFLLLLLLLLLLLFLLFLFVISIFKWHLMDLQISEADLLSAAMNLLPRLIEDVVQMKRR